MQMHAAYRPGGHRRSASAVRLAAARATAGCAVALGACGSPAGGGQIAARATVASGNAYPLGLSQCMRAHGVPSFADPSTAPVGDIAANRKKALSGSSAFNPAVRVCGGPGKP